MNRIRTKLILSLLAVALLPVIPSYFLVKDIRDRSIEIGFNKTVETAIEQSTDMSRMLYRKYRDETLAFVRETARSREIGFALRNSSPLPSEIAETFQDMGMIKILVCNADGEIVSSTASSDEQTFQPLDKSALLSIVDKHKPGFIDPLTDTEQIVAFAPIGAPQKPAGFVVVIRVLDAGFSESAGNILRVNQMFKTLDFISEDLKRSYLTIFFIVYGSLALLSIAVGYLFSHRITAPLLNLAKGTQIVASGNLDFRMEPTSGDEVGQLIRAFNNMTATIQEKQRIAKEEETQRIRMEKEAMQKAKDLEMSELKARALQAENERKSVELEKAKELEKAYEALELAHKELKEAQAQLIQSGKMASLGNLVAGVAHEINNPVGAMNSAADVSRRAVEKMSKFFADEKTQKDPHAQDRLAEVLKILKDNTQLICTGSSRVAKIVRSLKTFARLDEAEFQKTDIHQGLDSTLMLLQHEMKNRITVEKAYHEIPEISCYPDELNQVFMNLLSNAAQAIDGQGTIRIRTRVKNDTLEIDIEDNGRGIPQENVQKIFDPGFTTKGVGVGTGLGLSISYKIIQKHQGEIKVKSKLGKGSTFTVFIPTNLEERITETAQTESD